MPSTLYLLPTQLGDVAWPTVLPAGSQEIACRLQHFIVENAKTARATLKWLSHPTPLREVAIEQLPEPLTTADIDRLLSPLQAGHDMGLMSEAGCPGVADPGALIVRRAHEIGHGVKPLVGPSSLLLALMASGLDGQRFAFHGYLPVREPERSKRIVELEKESRHRQQTQLFIETPYRNTALLDALLATCHPETLLCLASDLTLPDETVATRRISAWRKMPRPELNRRPTVFLMLNAG
ncbi:MAG: SAM-dependent methyltransferase [Gammaproteobacteria bacterium]|nr:SAM-dependent methyltransferase [Gammaproteobacteria bacterium]